MKSCSIPGAASPPSKSSPTSTRCRASTCLLKPSPSTRRISTSSCSRSSSRFPRSLEIIQAEHGQIPFAVVSGGRRNSVTSSLTTLGLMDKFETIVGAEDYTNSKPAPDAYLIAAARLGVAPKDCLVFEDTDMGIQAATAAGMASVKIASPLERSLEASRAEVAGTDNPAAA